MMSKRAVFLSAIACFAAVVLTAGQVSKAPTKKSTSPHTAWGHPDLQGIWDNHSITPLERPARFASREFLTPQEAAELERRAIEESSDEARFENPERDVEAAYNDFWWDRATNVVKTHRTSLIVDPPDGKIPPLVAEARDRQGEAELNRRPLRATGGFEAGRGADSWFDRSLWERCITQGLPRISSIAYNSNIQIVQSPEQVVILYEMIHEARIIPLNGSPHLDARVRLWLGDSRGHWEGDTLVVDTTNFSDKTNFRGSTSGLHMIERYTRVDSDTLNYEVTFDDPATWTRPWKVAIPWRKSRGRIYEYACHEGNYGMIGILNGGREEDKAKEAAPKNSPAK
jgi:hypothetical protein